MQFPDKHWLWFSQVSPTENPAIQNFAFIGPRHKLGAGHSSLYQQESPMFFKGIHFFLLNLPILLHDP